MKAARRTAQREMVKVEIIDDPAPDAPDDFTAIERGFFDEGTASSEEADLAGAGQEVQPQALRRGLVAAHGRALLAAAAFGVLLLGGALWAGTGGAKRGSNPPTEAAPPPTLIVAAPVPVRAVPPAEPRGTTPPHRAAHVVKTAAVRAPAPRRTVAKAPAAHGKRLPKPRR
jgi:hypothetical protein